MYNIFAYRRDREISNAVQRSKAKSLREAAMHTQRTEELRKLSVGRALEWTKAHISKEFTQALHTGAAGPEDKNEWVLGTRSKDSSPNVYVRKYQPDKERVAAAETDYQNTHLNTSSDYDPKSPHKHMNWLRETDPGKFVGPARAVLHPQDATSRLNTAASKTRLTVLEGFDLYSALNPSLRARAKAKEIDLSEFNRFPNSSTTFSTPKQPDSDPYIDSLEPTVALLKRRDKSKDVSPKSFVTTSRDPWRTLPSQGMSLREKKTEDHMKKLEVASSVPNISHKAAQSTSTKVSNASSAGFSPKYYVKTYQTHITLAPLSLQSPQASPTRCQPIKPSHISQITP